MLIPTHHSRISACACACASCFANTLYAFADAYITRCHFLMPNHNLPFTQKCTCVCIFFSHSKILQPIRTCACFLCFFITPDSYITLPSNADRIAGALSRQSPLAGSRQSSGAIVTSRSGLIPGTSAAANANSSPVPVTPMHPVLGSRSR